MEPSAINGMLPMLQSVLAGTEFKVSEQSKVVIVTQSGQQVSSYFDRRDGKTIYPKANEPYVMVNPIKTAIYKYDQACGPTGTKTHQKVIQDYLNDPNCIGIVLDVDSGGGQVSGTAEFYDFIKSATKPIVTYTDGVLASAAYYIASATNKIIANPRADLIGSIGTMISFVDLTGYYEKQGAKVITEYSTKSTGKNKSWRELIAGKPENYIQTQLDPLTDTFINDVKSGRANVNEDVFDGSTYRVEQALEMGLIDEIGQIEDVIQSLFQNNNQIVNNSKSNMKMSNHAKVMAAIGVATLAITDDKGSYFNEEQLQSMEDALAANENQIETLTGNLQTAKDALATAQANEQLAKEAQANSLKTIATALGLEEGATQEAIIERIGSLNTGHTNPPPTPKPTENKNSIVDENASHNQLANQIFK